MLHLRGTKSLVACRPRAESILEISAIAVVGTRASQGCITNMASDEVRPKISAILRWDLTENTESGVSNSKRRGEPIVYVMYLHANMRADPQLASDACLSTAVRQWGRWDNQIGCIIVTSRPPWAQPERSMYHGQTHLLNGQRYFRSGRLDWLARFSSVGEGR